jgi:hypothetical protein
MSYSSPLWNDATRLYLPWEVTIDSWDQLVDAINTLSDYYHAEDFAWRGQSDARWGLKSSLYRAVTDQLGHVPSEAELRQAERRLLDLARIDWRLDGIPALQLLARLQHVGAPTRLIDATLNPLIATWFAVAAGKDAKGNSTDAIDGRLFAFTVRKPIQLNSMWNANRPRWHYPAPDRPTDWGTGDGRRVWRPPALHPRIPAQSAVFLLDGVPAEGSSSPRKHPDDASTWTVEETREVASIPVRFARIRPESRQLSKSYVFTYRIRAAAKSQIRRQLEDRFGYRFATIYADIEGLAEYLRTSPGELLGV